jgi:hypothetical protein
MRGRLGAAIRSTRAPVAGVLLQVAVIALLADIMLFIVAVPSGVVDCHFRVAARTLALRLFSGMDGMDLVM